MVEYANDPRIVDLKFERRENFGGHDRTVVSTYIPKLSREVEGEEAPDPYAQKDMELAAKVHGFLATRFPIAYDWCVRSDIAQGVVLVSIPVLMGINNWMAIHINHPDFSDKVVDLAGEILERYLLPRDKYDLGKFLEARAKHSALVVPGRPVPA